VLLAPPFIMNDAQIEEVVTKLTQSIEAALQQG